MHTFQNTEQSAYAAPIVSKALKVLKMILTTPNNAGVSEIAATLGMAKSTTHGILAALEDTGWVLRDPITKKYTCGYTAKDLAPRMEVNIGLIRTARPHLESLGAELGEDIFLGVRSGRQLLILDQIESFRELKIRARPGMRMSKFAGAVGKIFLAYREPEEAEKIVRGLSLPAFTSESITDPEVYLAELALVREEGIAVDINEYLPHVWAVAAPIFYGKKARRRMVAAFWIVGLGADNTGERLRKAELLVHKTSEALSDAVTNNSKG